MALAIRRTLVVGLGGTGLKAVLFMKKKLIEQYGEIPSMIKFVVFDTADPTPLSTSKGEIVLERGEFLKLEVESPITLIRTNPEVRAWIPERVPTFALTNGAKQIRPLGRLAVFANADEVYTKLMTAIEAIKNYAVGAFEKYDTTSNTLVNIVFSVAGGTGSGCYFDIAVLLREFVSEKDRLVGYILLPDVFKSKPATDYVEPNAYAAIREISHFFDSEVLNNPLVYQFGGKKRTVQRSLFDAVYMVNNHNVKGVAFSEVEEVAELLGLGMVAQCSAPGKNVSDIYDNLEATLTKGWYDQPTVFSSFGLSELYYPGDWYAEFYAKQIALNVVRSVLIDGTISSVHDTVEDFVNKIDIREDSADDVINAILKNDNIRKFPLPSAVSKSTITTVLTRRDGHINEAKVDLAEIALENLAHLKTEKLAAVNEFLAEKLSQPQTLEFCESFLGTLIAHLREYKKMIVQERDQFIKQEQALPNAYQNASAELEKASKKMFGVNAAIEEALKKYKGLIDKHVSLIAEQERREKTADFFSFLIEKLEKTLAKLTNISNYAQALERELAQEVKQMQLSKKTVKPFQHEILTDSLKGWKPEVQPNDFLVWLKGEKHLSVLDFGEMKLEELKSLLIEYGYAQKSVQEVRDRKIEDVLRTLPEDEFKRMVRLLDEMATPLWQYDRGYISGAKKTENIRLFAVEDANNTLMEFKNIQKFLSMNQPPSLVSTGDSKRITSFKVESAVPAFVINNMRKYQALYENPETNRYSFHIHKDWPQKLRPVTPPEGLEERKYWSLAVADPFNLITKKGEHYYVLSQKKGELTKGNLVKLAQGRIEAMKSFLADQDLVAEIRDSIEAISKKLGNNVVVQHLTAYGEDLATRMQQSKAGDEGLRLQIENELRDIQEYVENLTSLQ